MIDWDRTARGTLRTLFSLLIAAFFLIVLMVASAQQQASNRLDSKIGYSAARKMLSEASQARGRLETLQTRLDKLEEDASKAAQDTERQQNALGASMARVTLVAQNMRRTKICDDLTAAENPEGQALWGIVYSCWRDKKMSAADSNSVSELAARDKDPTVIVAAIATLNSDRTVALAKIDVTKGKIAVAQGVVEDAAEVERSLQDVRVLDESFIGWMGLTWIPPSMLQILLSFLSGLFGSLLITLILIVYPNNSLSFTGSQSYWSRIFLGGLIAVGVYIIIGGGVAVLGSTDGLLDGSTNFLSFCAIGMLAGMFSDKFAGWLSDRAQTFISSGGVLPAPPPRPAPPPAPLPPTPPAPAEPDPPLSDGVG